MSPKSAKRGKRGGTNVGDGRTHVPDGTGGGRKRPVRPQGSAQTRRRAGRPPEIESDETRLPIFDPTRRRTLSLRFSGPDAVRVTAPGNGVAPVVKDRHDRFPPGWPFHHPACPRLLGTATAGA